MTINEVMEALSQLKEIYGGDKKLMCIRGSRFITDDCDAWSFKNGKLECFTEEFMKPFVEENS